MYGNAQKGPGVLKRTQNMETWRRRTCCLCTFYQSDSSGWWISHPISSQKNICLKPLWLNIWIWESNFVRLFVLIAINAAARKLSWQFHFLVKYWCPGSNMSKNIFLEMILKNTLASTYRILTRHAVAKRFVKFQVKLATMYFQH